MLKAKRTQDSDRIECGLSSTGVCQGDFLYSRSRERGGWICTESVLSSALIPFKKELDQELRKP